MTFTIRVYRKAAVVGLSSALFACEREKPPDPVAPTVEEVRERPATFHGRTLTLSGEVDRVYSDRAFELQADDDPFEIWEEELLVLTRSPIRLTGGALADDQDVIVTGTVRNFVVADVEREIGWDLLPEIEADYRNVPVLVANSVTRVHREGAWTEGGEPLIASYTLIVTTDPVESLAGTKVSIDSVPVRRVTDKALWIGYAHTRQLLVVPNDANQLAGISEGESIRVEGTLEKMPPANEAIAKFSLSPTLRAQIAEEPLVLKASSIAKRTPQGDAGAQDTRPQDAGRSDGGPV